MTSQGIVLHCVTIGFAYRPIRYVSANVLDMLSIDELMWPPFTQPLSSDSTGGISRLHTSYLPR